LSSQTAQRLRAGSRKCPAQGGDEVTHKRQRIAVFGVERQPGGQAVTASEPMRNQRSLAIPGRRHQHGERQRTACFELRQQLAARNKVSDYPRAMQLAANNRDGGHVDLNRLPSHERSNLD
jgi:hypothetical protein